MPDAQEAVLESLRERVRTAARNCRPLRLRGHGSKDFYGEALAGDVLELSSYAGIIDYEPSELFIRARCGTPLSVIEATLAAQGQHLAFEPPRPGADPTIGGVVASGLSGPARLYLGAARDFVLGARLLDGQGELLAFGGNVMKNVAGFDVARLLCGSLGILGILTEVAIKVLPRPRAERTVRLELSAADAVERFNRLAAQPLPLTACAWHEGQASLRISGAEPAVEAARVQLGGEVLDAGMAQAFWRDIRDYRLAHFSAATLWRISVPATTAPLPLPGAPLIDGGGAVRWYADLPPGTAVREIADAAGGTAQCWRAPERGTSRFAPLSPVVLELHRRLKARFDPHGIFNPGRLVPGL